MTACPIRYQRQVPDRKGKIFYTSITSLSHISKGTGLIVSGRKIIPFDRRVPKDSAIYKLCQTDFRRDVT